MPHGRGSGKKTKPLHRPTDQGTSAGEGSDVVTRRGWRWPVVVFFVCFGAYLSNGAPLPGDDARGNMLVALNLLKHGSVLIAAEHAATSFAWTTSGNMTYARITHWDDEKAQHYREGHLKPDPPYYLAPTVHPGRYANVFGIGAALPVLPVYAALNLVTDLASNHVLWWHSTKVTASLLTAGAALFIFLTMRRFVPPLPAALGALAFGLGTCAWTLSSQVLWQQTAFLFFLSLGAWWLFDAHARRDCALYCGAAFGMAALCRPTGLIVVAFTGLYLLRTAPRHVFRYVLGGLPFAVPLLLYNTYAFGGPFAFGQEIAAEGIAQTKGLTEVWQTSMAEGFAGLLVSPSRGLFVYSPFMVFGFVGAVMAWRDPQHYAPLIPLQAAVLVQIVLAAMWFDWWGGFSYGPRPLVDAGVFLTLLMIPILARVGPANWIRGIFVTLLLYSVAVQVIGAWSYHHDGWNGRNGMNIDDPAHRHRLWSLSDSQIVHHVTNFQAERNGKQALIHRFMNPGGPTLSSHSPGEPSP